MADWRRYLREHWRYFDAALALVVIVGSVAYIYDLLVGSRGLDVAYIVRNYTLYLHAVLTNVYATTIAFLVGMVIGFSVGWLRTARTVALSKFVASMRVEKRERQESPSQSEGARRPCASSFPPSRTSTSDCSRPAHSCSCSESRRRSATSLSTRALPGTFSKFLRWLPRSSLPSPSRSRLWCKHSNAGSESPVSASIKSSVPEAFGSPQLAAERFAQVTPRPNGRLVPTRRQGPADRLHDCGIAGKALAASRATKSPIRPHRLGALPAAEAERICHFAGTFRAKEDLQLFDIERPRFGSNRSDETHSIARA